MIQTQAVIIGAGPIGLELAVPLKRLGVNYLHFDSGQIGQTVSWYPRQARFFSSPERIAIAGVPLHTIDQSKATREEYLSYLRSIVEQFDLQVRTYERITHIARERDGFVIRTLRGEEENAYAAQHVILAVGDMHAPRRLHIPGEDLDHVSHYFDEPHKYFRQRLLIVGGRNSAAEAALRCHRAGAKVSISYRRPNFDSSSIKYWILPELESLIKHGQITFHPCTSAKQITRGHVHLAPSDHLDCRDTPPCEPFNVEADFVLLLTGYVMDTTLFEIAGVELEGPHRAPHHNPKTMETNVPGLYIAGTAAAGTQERYRLFIENCHVHVERVVRAITGQELPSDLINRATQHLEMPES